LDVSAGVAGGNLIRKVRPIYPEIAKAARVSGTVVLAATITRDGFVTNLQVVSGPQMLRQAAIDAVRDWRYRPYLLNNQPMEVQTTIDVDFNL
jgi:protein TonB